MMETGLINHMGKLVTNGKRWCGILQRVGHGYPHS